MTWTPEVTYINQRIQIGAESTSSLGVAVAASKLLQCFDFQFAINGDIVFYTPTGHKYPTEQAENTEWVDGTLGGNLDYNGIIYPLASIMGSVSPVAHGASATAKDWIFTPPLTGSVVPQTYTFQQGDSTRARSASYLIFPEFGYKGSRKQITVAGKMFAQPLSDGITLTSNPTAVAIAPVVGKHVNVYLDSTSAGLGTTQLTRVTNIDYLMSNVYGLLYPLNRTNVGWTAHVDLMPKTIAKLKVEADANGMALLGYLQSGTTYYLRIQAQGSVAIATDGPGNIFNTITHDMAVKLNKPTGVFHDDQGIFAVEWELDVVEDPVWGKAQTITVTNLITAL